MKKIATKLAKKLKKAKSEKVISLVAYKQMKNKLNEDLEQLNTVQSLVAKGHEPRHAIYMQAQNLMSLIFEALSEFRELDRINNILNQAEDMYTPSWPPMSPISGSSYFAWSSFDVKVGLDNESYGSCLLDLHKIVGLQGNMYQLMQNMVNSRFGVYQVLDQIEGTIFLQELVTKKRYKCVSATQYPFIRGQLWLTRLLAPVLPDCDIYVMFCSPYILVNTAQEWLAFFERNIKSSKKYPSIESAYDEFMRSGHATFYWVEFFMQAYVNYTDVSITLTGLPDISSSRPHACDNNILGPMSH
jgi:hypothetical protein